MEFKLGRKTRRELLEKAIDLEIENTKLKDDNADMVEALNQIIYDTNGMNNITVKSCNYIAKTAINKTTGLKSK
jgi:hypothetical protein